MKRLRGALVSLVIAPLLFGAGDLQAQPPPSVFNEDFTTTRYKNLEYTGAWWDTLAGEIKPYPFSMSVRWTVDTPGTAAGVVVNGDVAYVADSGSLRSYDITDAWFSPPLLGSIARADIQALAVDGNRVFAACGGSGFYIFDVSHPATPVELAHLPGLGNVRGVTTTGDLAFLACDYAGLAVIDIADVAHPQLRGLLDTSGRATWVAVSGDVAFVSDGPDGLKVVDMSDPAHPSLVGGVDTPVFSECVTVDGDQAFVADGDPGGLRVYDIRAPAAPQLVGTYSAPGAAQRVRVDGDYAFVLFGGSFGLKMIDISDPTNPRLARSLEGQGFSGGRDIDLAGEFAYVADGSAGLRSVAIAYRITPRVAGQIPLPNQTGGLALAGNYAYAASWQAGLQVVDITDPLHPLPAGLCNLSDYAASVAVTGDVALVGTTSSGDIRVVDIHDPTHPAQVGSCALGYRASEIAIAGDHAYVAADQAGLKVLDISTPSAPLVVGGYDTPGNAWAVAVAGDYAYVADGNSLQILDITLTSPILVGVVSLPWLAWDVAIQGHHTFVSCRENGLHVVDVSDPATPAVVGSLDTPGFETDLAVRGDLVILGSTAGLHSLDISDPEHPVLVGSSDPPPPPLSSGWYDVPQIAGNYAVTVLNSLNLRVVEVVQRKFHPWGYQVLSTRVATPSYPIYWARVTTAQSDSIRWRLSADDGGHWEDVVPGVSGHVFAYPGRDLKWRADLAYTGVNSHPSCGDLQIDWLDAFPLLTSIKDVPHDQGLQLRLTWLRSGHDFPGSGTPITQYAVYRRIDEALAGAATPPADKAGARPGRGVPESELRLYPPGSWDFVLTVPARTEQTYSVVVPTLVDSTVAGGRHDSTFFVSALTGSPAIYFDSPPDSGYSVDNLPPAVVAGFRVDYRADGNWLHWNPSPDPDFACFRVYRGPQPDFEPGPGSLVRETTTTEWWDAAQFSLIRYYKLTCVDRAGNESLPVLPGDVSGAPGFPTERPLLLYPNEPNPFNPRTDLRFELPIAGHVRLSIVDVTGRTVAVLVRGWLPAGPHRARWDGRCDDGRPAAAGIYLSLLQTAGGLRQGKLTLLR